MKILKILFTLLVLMIATYYFVMALSIGASSHPISIDERNYAELKSKIAIALGIALIILVWIPWKRIKK